VGDGGILLPELSVASVRAALERVLHADPSLDALRARALDRAAGYSWEETARGTLAVYHAALHADRAAPPA